jgi:hypothetical protein
MVIIVGEVGDPYIVLLLSYSISIAGHINDQMNMDKGQQLENHRHHRFQLLHVLCISVSVLD